MGIVNRVKAIAGGRGSAGFEYECEQCAATFHAPDRNPSEVSCPDCGSARVYRPL